MNAEPLDTSVWYIVAQDCDRRGTEWVLYGLGDGPDVGKVEAHSQPWFVGEFDRARDLWRAFAQQ